MIVVVGTVKDTRENLEVYLERNLRAGADHVVLFLDAPDAQVEEWAAAQPHVTHVVCDESYWLPTRPERLNARQVTNANLVQAALACVEGEHWLFHLDADESLQLDRERLETDVPARVTAVMLSPLEAISQLEPRPDIPHFKRLLGRPGIDKLVALGAIAPLSPDDDRLNSTYFRGHLLGKVGVRPGLDQWMQLHRAVHCGPEEDAVETFRADWLAHRHYESVSGRAFIDKWMAHLAAGQIRLRPRRRQLSLAIAAVMEDDSLDEAGKQAALTRIYTEQVQDKYDVLLAAGVLTVPEDHDYAPRDFPLAAFERVLGVLLAGDKRPFNPRVTDVWPRPHMQQLARRHPELAPAVAPAIDAALASERARGAKAPGAPKASLWARVRGR